LNEVPKLQRWEKKLNYSLVSKTAASLLMVGALAACGGGGGTASVGPASSVFSGIAATGAPLLGASVVVTDATGLTVGSATTSLTDGSYTLSFDPTKFTAPFVITVTGSVGEASTTLVSVQPTNDTATVNVTPITNAISALLSSTGNPADLVANIATDKVNLTAVNINATEHGFRAAFADNMTAVGLTSSDNLLSGTFTAKFDKLLDNVHVEVSPSGEIQISSNAGAAVDDLAPTGTQPAAALTVVLPKGTVPSAADAANLPKPAGAGVPVGVDALEAGRLALNACFAVVPAASRATAPACANLLAPTYLYDGRNGTQELSGVLNDSGNDNMQFQKPEILRQLSTTLNNERLLVRLSATRGDGLIRAITTVAENNPTGIVGWALVGNQRVYETFVNGVASKRVSANTPANNRYETGLNLYVTNTLLNNNPATPAIASVVITGPGLPGNAPGTGPGITLKPKSGCDFLAIANGTGATPNCASFYRLRSLMTDSTAFVPPAGNAYLFDLTKTDADILTIKPLDLYKFVITKTAGAGGGTITYWNRLRSRPLTIAEMGVVKFVDYTPSSLALMTTASLYTGGAAPTAGWTVPANGPKPGRVYFFHANGSDWSGVRFSSSSATIACTGNTDCAPANDGSYNTGLNTTGQYIFQTVARNRFDTQIFTQLVQ
jgi:hypothetical protein